MHPKFRKLAPESRESLQLFALFPGLKCHPPPCSVNSPADKANFDRIFPALLVEGADSKFPFDCIRYLWLTLSAMQISIWPLLRAFSQSAMMTFRNEIWVAPLLTVSGFFAKDRKKKRSFLHFRSFWTTSVLIDCTSKSGTKNVRLRCLQHFHPILIRTFEETQVSFPSARFRPILEFRSVARECVRVTRRNLPSFTKCFPRFLSSK